MTTIEQQAVVNYLRRNHLRLFAPTAALIDMDGTLYDSMPRHADAWYRLMTEEGVECSHDEFFLYEGRTGRDTIRLLFRRAFGREVSSERCEELYRRKTLYFSELPAVEPMPGADRMVAGLRRRGLATVLVTGSGQRSLIDRLERDYPGAFPAVMQITSRDVVHGKPDPEPFLRAMAKAGATPTGSIAIDNAPMGVLAGARSGAFTVAVTTGPIPERELRDAGADIIYPSMPAMADSLDALFDAFATVTNPINIQS